MMKTHCQLLFVDDHDVFAFLTHSLTPSTDAVSDEFTAHLSFELTVSFL